MSSRSLHALSLNRLIFITRISLKALDTIPGGVLLLISSMKECRELSFAAQLVERRP